MTKYEKAVLLDRNEAIEMAELREDWAATARENDKPGSAYEFELAALLLRYYAATKD